MKQDLSICGLLCNECEHYGNKCKGCRAVRGSTFWAKQMMPDKTCPLYKCCAGKKYKDCGQCKELPCKVFREMKDPNTTEAQHQKSLRDRVARLKSH
jgi:hypothetical protein